MSAASEKIRRGLRVVLSRNRSPLFLRFAKWLPFLGLSRRLYGTNADAGAEEDHSRAIVRLLGRLTSKLLKVRRRRPKRSLTRETPSLSLAFLRLHQLALHGLRVPHLKL
jgi:hypothetical protein